MAEASVVRDGEGTTYEVQGDPWTFLATGDSTDGTFDFMEGQCSYAQGPPLHVHHAQWDTFYVLDGTLTLQIGDDVIDIGPGEFAAAPPGTPHTFTNKVPDTTVRMINVVTPGGFDKLLAEVAGIPPGPPDPEAIADLGARHGAGFVGPPLAMTLGLVDGGD